MGVQAQSADCPRDKGFSIRFGTGLFKCRVCGFEFKKNKGNKYGAKKSTDGTESFDSALEVRYLRHLRLRQAVGQISNIRWKPTYEVDTGVFYKPEVTYFDHALGTDITADAKGGATKGGRFPTICKLWKNHMDHPLHVVEQDKEDRRTGAWKTTRKVLPRNPRKAAA